jgi:hypothetical protein
MCDSYAIEVLGSHVYSPWLYVYSAFCGEFKEGWIPDNYYGSVVVPKYNSGEYGRLSSLKSLNRTIFKSDVFPDMLSYVNGVFLDVDNQHVTPATVSKLLFSKQDRVVFKLDSSRQGRDIYFYDKHNFSLEQVKHLGNGVFQKFVHQNPVFDQFTSKSVATIRITTTFSDEGTVAVCACYLRFGSGNDTHVQSRSHVRVPVNIVSGQLSECGYDTRWLPLPSHPDSKAHFDGVFVPNFPECIRIASQLHSQAPFARCIGWDLTVDDLNLVHVLEWNAEHNDVKFSEATQGPCFIHMNWHLLQSPPVALWGGPEHSRRQK